MKHDHKTAEETRLTEAEKRLEAKIGLFIHLAVAVSVGILLTTINLCTQTDYLWFRWPVLGLSLSVIFHALAISFESGSIRKKIVNAEIGKLGSSG